MIPRADIDAVSSDIKIDKLITFINKTKHSRIPVFQDNLDKIIGMIHIRDLFEKVNNKKKRKLKSFENNYKEDSVFISFNEGS
jgi:CBS domain containing-hemolysin-like protein